MWELSYDCYDRHYGTNAVFFYLETVLFLCFKHRAVFFRAKLHLKLGNLNKLRGILTKTVLFLCKKHWNAVLKTLESGVFYTTLYRSERGRETEHMPRRTTF
jgi:hypothetical protein